MAAAPRQIRPVGPYRSSSLSRCLQTCDLLLPGQPREVDADLREQDWGDWTGQTLKEIIEASPGSIAAQERLGWDLTPPGGESRRVVLAESSCGHPPRHRQPGW